MAREPVTEDTSQKEVATAYSAASCAQRAGRWLRARRSPHVRRAPALFALVGSVLAVCILPGAAAETRPGPQTHTITIENVQYNPQQLTVKRGDRIVWINKDLFPHTVTSTTHAFDSGSIAPNAKWTYVARKSGEYAYTCTFHPTMKAQLTVR